MPRLIVLRAIPVARAVAGTPPNPRGQGFIGRKQPPPALVKKRGGQLPARADVIKVDHSSRLSPGHRAAPTKFAILSLRSQGPVDSFISPQALSLTVSKTARKPMLSMTYRKAKFARKPRNFNMLDEN